MADQDDSEDTGTWAAIIVGIVMAVPVSAILANQAPLAMLQERYAAAALSDVKFERRLDVLLDSDRRAEDADRIEATAVERDAVLERE